jgi:DNA-directed RNA polymerase subunit RPC12/RpoP
LVVLELKGSKMSLTKRLVEHRAPKPEPNVNHKLDLYENALDSFNEALTRFKEGVGGNVKAYKFAIQHLSHSIELLFKSHIAQIHPLLIYKNPFTNKPLDRELTIGLWDAVQFLRNTGDPISKDFEADLLWLKKLRNEIEHSRFDMDVVAARSNMGRLVEAVRDFHEHFDDDLSAFVTAENLPLFEELSDEYKRSVGEAKAKARTLSEDGEVYDCEFCSERGTGAMVDRAIACQYCGESNFMIECCRCGADERVSDATLWNDERDSPDYLCSSCHAHYESLCAS